MLHPVHRRLKLFNIFLLKKSIFMEFVKSDYEFLLSFFFLTHVPLESKCKQIFQNLNFYTRYVVLNINTSS